jgi:hypothetical protein
MNKDCSHKKLRLFTLGWAIALIAVLAMPVVYGYMHTPPNKVFLGIGGLYPTEQFYYLSVGASQVYSNSFLFAERYGRIADENVFLNPIANVLRLFASLTNWPLTIVFNLFILCSSVLLNIAFLQLAKQFIANNWVRFWALVFYCIVAGLGGIANFLKLPFDPFDDSVPEANVFMAMSGEYYLPLANALFILSLTYVYRLFIKEEKTLWRCGLSLFALGTVYIYGLILAVTITTCIGVWAIYKKPSKWMALKNLIALALFCAPVVAYYMWLLLHLPGIDDEGWYNFPPFSSLLFTFAFGLFLTAMGFATKPIKLLRGESFLYLWILVTILLVSIPQNFLPIQYQLLIGLGAPLAILSVNTLARVLNILTVGDAVFNLLMLGVVLVCSTTSLLFYSERFSELNKGDLPYYIDKDLHEAILWCKNNIPQNQPVMVSRKLAFIYSGYTGGRVYCGIAPIHEKTKEDKNIDYGMQLIETGKADKALNYFRKLNIHYIFFDETLNNMGRIQKIKALEPFAHVLFTNRHVTVLSI